MKNIVVYSCVAGNIDDLQSRQKWGKADWVIFTDQKFTGGNWKVEQLKNNIPDSPRRTARWHKTNPHILFPDYEYTIWIDGTVELLVTPESLVEKYLKYADIATLNHPDRNCVYEEADACKYLKLDSDEVIDKQMLEYKRQAYPKKNGLSETKVVIRRNSTAITDFNEMWGDEIRRGSLRDQLSFDFCTHVLGLNVNHMPTWKISDEIKYHFHLDRRK